MWTRFLVASHVDPVVLVSSFLCWSQEFDSLFFRVAPDATSQKEISERTIYVQKGEKTGSGRCYGQEETRPFSDIFSLSGRQDNFLEYSHRLVGAG